MDPALELLLFLLLLCCSAYFSGTETSFFSLSPLRLKKLEDEGDRTAGEILSILSDKQRLLIVLLLGNTFVNVAATTLATHFVIRWVESSEYLAKSFIGNSPSVAIAIASFFMTVIILFCGEVTPKTIAINNSMKIASVAVYPLKVLIFILNPFSSMVIWFLKKTVPTYSDWNKNLGSATSMDEIDSYFSLGEEVGIIEHEEKEMLSSVFEFGDTAVREVMTPRPDIISIPSTISFDDLLKIVRDDGHSRFPVYESSLDKIVGIFYVKDLFIQYDKMLESYNLSSILRPAYFVPESKKLDELLKEFQKRKLHMAIVVDEYGGISGVATIEDLVEEIVGEIVDEYDNEEQESIQTIDSGVYMVNASTGIKDLEEEMGLTLDYEDSETVGGFVLEKLGRIPKRDETVEESGVIFVVSEMKGNRILKVKVEKKVLSEKTPDQKI
ncbi:MAG: HlyC/CorC family transporter [Candidatus Riflebacteria bacterium]|nr:HlyC/CorC family transporter [Candidatus Riflebacteria bacterium]